jgi:hypothetical protein
MAAHEVSIDWIRDDDRKQPSVSPREMTPMQPHQKPRAVIGGL